MPQNPNHDSVIPAAVRGDERLPAAVKLLHGKDGKAANSLLVLTHLNGPELEARLGEEAGAAMVRQLREFCKVIPFDL